LTIIYGQDATILLKDTALLTTLWTEFKTAVTANDKLKLMILFEFPFYCGPCTDDTTFKKKVPR
jgi:hypothetical protein